MGCVGSLVASAAGSAMSTACCSVCGRLTPEDDRFGKVSRIPYLFLTILSGIFAVFMTLYGEAKFNLSFFYSGSLCSDNHACDGDGSVYRICFCLFLFFGIHVLLVPMANDFHWVLFPVKFLLFVVGVCITFFLKDSQNTDFYNTWASNIAPIGSILYLLIQILILIDWAWNVKEWFETKADKFLESLNLDFEEIIEKYRCYHNKYILMNVILTCILYFGSLAVVCLFYSDNLYGGCALNQLFITFTLVIILLNFVFSGIAGGGTFTVASLMSFYAMFLLYNAMSSEKTIDCNPYYKTDSGSKWLGILFTLVTLCYSGMKADLLGGAVDMSGVSCFGCCPGYAKSNDNERKASMYLNDIPNNINDPNNENGSNYDENAGFDDGNNKNKQKNNTGNDVTVSMIGNNNNSSNTSKDNDDDEDEDDDKPKISKKQKKKNTIYFHLILMLASCYMAMLFTNWGTSTSGIQTGGMISAWANIGVQWASMLLFWQTLLIYRKETKSNGDE